MSCYETFMLISDFLGLYFRYQRSTTAISIGKFTWALLFFPLCQTCSACCIILCLHRVFKWLHHCYFYILVWIKIWSVSAHTKFLSLPFHRIKLFLVICANTFWTLLIVICGNIPFFVLVICASSAFPLFIVVCACPSQVYVLVLS